MARRTFLQTSAGLTGAALTVGQWAPALAAEGNADPKPIPGGLDLLGNGTTFHVFLPGPEFGHNEETSVITDLNGHVGIARVQGTGVGKQNDVSAPYSFDVDVRFMDGLYIGVDKRNHQGTFALVWLDVFLGSVSSGKQVHDFNPGVNPFPGGLFWLVKLPSNSLSVNLPAGTARLTANNLAIEDYTNIVNALASDPPAIPEIGSTTSFDIRWSGVITRVHRKNVTEGFQGDFVETNATIKWSAKQIESPFFSFVTDDPDSSPQTTVFAQIGREGNGVFIN